MSVTLSYSAKTSIPVEVDGVLPDRLAGKSLAEIERLEVAHGNRQCALADLFSIAGDASDGRIDFEGNLAGVHHIGAGMIGGEIHVHGDAGRHVGREMAGRTDQSRGKCRGLARRRDARRIDRGRWKCGRSRRLGLSRQQARDD